MEANNGKPKGNELKTYWVFGANEDGAMYGISDSGDVSSIQALWSAEDGEPVEVHFLPDIVAKAIYVVDNNTGEIVDELYWSER